MLCLRVTDRGGATVVEVIGELDLGSAHLLTDCVDQIAGDRPNRVVLDLARVSFFCADGLRALLHARDTITATGGQLLLRAPSAKVRRVLALTAADELFIFAAADHEPGPHHIAAEPQPHPPAAGPVAAHRLPADGTGAATRVDGSDSRTRRGDGQLHG